MRRLKFIIGLFPALALVAICTSSCSEKGEEEQESPLVELRKIQTDIIPGMDVGLSSSRAGVVTVSDPTATSIINRGAFAWKLDVTLYRGGTVYTPGKATFINSGTNSWTPQSPTIVYFPNYTNITGDFKLYPTAANTPVSTDQSSADYLLQQDILAIANTPVTPAHILNITLKHAQSLLDFSFDRIPLDVVSVQVNSAGNTYTPYKVPGTNQYLLILPSVVTTSNPTIVITTPAGATYMQVVKIIGNTSIGSPSALGVNMRYIFKLIGLELGLSPISVVDWVSGGMLAGDYVGVTAYPTFRGPANSNCILTFDTGLTQELLFNSQGECTIKPTGRIITRVTVGNDSCPTTILLDNMIIDLNNIINQCTTTP